MVKWIKTDLIGLKSILRPVDWILDGNPIDGSKEEKELNIRPDLLTRKDKFILDKDHNLIPVDLMQWAEFMENPENKIVRQQTVNDKFISTVFLGIDHGFSILDKVPLVFETMVFPREGFTEDYCDRYATWDDALIGHKKAVQWVKDGCKEEDLQ